MFFVKFKNWIPLLTSRRARESWERDTHWEGGRPLRWLTRTGLKSCRYPLAAIAFSPKKTESECIYKIPFRAFPLTPFLPVSLANSLSLPLAGLLQLIPSSRRRESHQFPTVSPISRSLASQLFDLYISGRILYNLLICLRRLYCFTSYLIHKFVYTRIYLLYNSRNILLYFFFYLRLIYIIPLIKS